MYDTINFCLNKGDIGTFDIYSFQDKLSNFRETWKMDNSSYITANFGNLRIVWNERGISFNGSMPKKYLGNNFQTLDCKLLTLAIEQFSDVFSLPLKKAKVRRLDLAGNLIMNFSPLIYYPYLGNCRTYVRLVQPKSIYYINNFRKKIFYDKIAESKSKMDFVPKDYFNKYVLRYELAYMKNLNKQFNCTGIYLEELCNSDFYLSLINQWEKEYKLIRKLRKMEYPDYTIIKTKKQLHLLGILHSIQAQGGIQNVLESLNEGKIKGDLTRKQGFDLRQEYIRASEHPQLTKKSDLIAELDKKIDLLCQSLKGNL